ncbi:MAG: cytochrome c-type biogenesis protein CcmH [Anaerolineae bacterium]|nr:cytochrome c-type biogenesis protein CcmH [Anaerolineae bacterium]
MTKYSAARFALLFVVLAGILLSPVGVFAQVPTPSDDDVNRVAKQLYCPVCENIPLDVCPTQACQEWRDLIRLKLSEGWSDEQIRQYFAQQYGDRVLSEPPRSGLNWLVYVLPPVIILAGAVLVARVLQSMRKPVLPAAKVDVPLAEDDLKRVEEELRKVD